ncbi:aquaporin [Paraburkholderia saeva]|uniref:aquaporin n=1 Tax=Paraburkholderia saeva TaxID=2777537 RepID=UPI001DF1F615|nr:aquaporin [Paraburkholderia saeva]CAG4894241.1 Aquaporin Z 2 [Paraburkholderia saeva]
MVSLSRRLLAEGAGTAWIVFIGCGSLILNGAQSPGGGAGLVVPVAFGLALAIASYAAKGFSGAHFNPAVTIGFAVAQRFRVSHLLPYIAAQILGATAGAALLDLIASGRPGFDLAISDFGANGYAEHSPADFQLQSAFVLELTMSLLFVWLNLQLSRRASRMVAPALNSACLCVIYMIAVPVTNGSINPARSSGPALFVGGWALDQLWLFWAAPIAGGVLAGLLHMRAGAGRKARATGAPREALERP